MTPGGVSCDLSDENQVKKLFKDHPASLVIHTAAYSDVDGCKHDPQQARAANVSASKFVSEACATHRVPWIYVDDHCRGILHALKKGKPGEIYNISSKTEMTNIELTRRLLKALDRPESLIESVKDRLGHDRRYAIDSSKLRRLGWKEKTAFGPAFHDTVLWYRENESWWKAIKDKKEEFGQYYAKVYGQRGS